MEDIVGGATVSACGSLRRRSDVKRTIVTSQCNNRNGKHVDGLKDTKLTIEFYFILFNVSITTTTIYVVNITAPLLSVDNIPGPGLIIANSCVLVRQSN